MRFVPWKLAITWLARLFDAVLKAFGSKSDADDGEPPAGVNPDLYPWVVLAIIVLCATGLAAAGKEIPAVVTILGVGIVFSSFIFARRQK